MLHMSYVERKRKKDTATIRSKKNSASQVPILFDVSTVQQSQKSVSDLTLWVFHLFLYLLFQRSLFCVR